MRYNPLQLTLIPQCRAIPPDSDNYYMLAQVAESYDEAKSLAKYARDSGLSVRIKKDNDGEYDEQGNYLLWVRLAKDTVRYFKAAGIITKVMVKTVMDLGRA